VKLRRGASLQTAATVCSKSLLFTRRQRPALLLLQFAAPRRKPTRK